MALSLGGYYQWPLVGQCRKTEEYTHNKFTSFITYVHSG